MVIKLWMISLLFIVKPLYTEGTSTTSQDNPVLLYSLISWGQIQGNVTFSWGGPGTNVTVSITAEFGGVEFIPEEEEYEWGIYEMPIRYDMPDRCHLGFMGKKLVDFDALFGKLTLPMASTLTFESDKVAIIGENSVWGRSLRISGTKTTCGNIQGVGGERAFEARLHYPIGGSIWLRTWSWNVNVPAGVTDVRSSGTEMLIITDVFNTFDQKPTSTQHDWNMYLTDIFDTEEHRSTCNFLTEVYDHDGRTLCDEVRCPDGKLTEKHGKLTVPASRTKNSRNIFHSSGKPLLDLSGPRQIYFGIEDPVLNNNVLACGLLREMKPKKVTAIFSSNGVYGDISMEQISVFTPTELTLNLHNLNQEAMGFHVHEVPFEKPLYPQKSRCGDTNGHYNPYDVDINFSPLAGLGTHDQYELGDLSGKHGMLEDLDTISATVIDHNLPLFGPRSVVGRSIVIHKRIDGSRWVCANLRMAKSMLQAVVTFRYPYVGEIVMEQDPEDPYAETTMFIGPFLYSDGSHNDTSMHRWHVHEKIPGRDFFNWTKRCVSAGGHYNPYQISLADRVYKSCGQDNQQRCETGDLFKRHGALEIAGDVRTAMKTKKVFTDWNMPLSGPKSILGHSIVVHDDRAPKHRGDRLACAGISRRFRYKGVVNRWTTTGFDRGGNDENLVDGSLEFVQESPFDLTSTEVDLKGLRGMASGYHVHMYPVLTNLAFPCAASTLSGHYNPLNATSPRPVSGETDDRYEIGDLSGKYGLLDGLNRKEGNFNDTNLPLFGPNSILGRSVLIHKKEKSERWFCGSIRWGYAPSEARQVSAIASFHHPKGFAWGYVRMRQLVYLDGSMSETFIEVNLRHPGTNNRNITRGHNWSVYVNPVGIDASVKFFQSRCVASGYRWNPFLIQLAHPNDHDYYDKQCTPEYPLRCDAGDLSGRLGTIDMGDQRFVFMDQNIPIAGTHTAMGKALIVHNSLGRVERFACANILPDDDIVKWTNIRKTVNFSPSSFMDEMREILGAPEWYLGIDFHTIKYSADRQCVTFRIHFLGPEARKLEREFSRLLGGGILHKAAIQIPGVYPDAKRKQKVGYRTCGGFEDQDLENFSISNNWWPLASSSIGRHDLRLSSILQIIIISLAVLFR